MDETGRRVPVFIHSTGELVGTGHFTHHLAGPHGGKIEVEGIVATYFRRCEMQGFAVAILSCWDEGLAQF